MFEEEEGADWALEWRGKRLGLGLEETVNRSKLSFLGLILFSGILVSFS